MASYNPVKFGSLNHSGRGDIFLVCPVVSEDHAIRGVCDFMGVSL